MMAARQAGGTAALRGSWHVMMLPLVAALAPAAMAAAASPKRNVLYIIADDLRPEFLGASSTPAPHPPPSTPLLLSWWGPRAQGLTGRRG